MSTVKALLQSASGKDTMLRVPELRGMLLASWDRRLAKGVADTA